MSRELQRADPSSPGLAVPPPMLREQLPLSIAIRKASLHPRAAPLPLFSSAHHVLFAVNKRCG